MFLRWMGSASSATNPKRTEVAASPTNSQKNPLAARNPAVAGPTGFGVIESDGRNCRLLHYGALRVDSRRQKESLGAALQDIHEALCKLLEEFLPQAMAIEGIFSALNVRTALRHRVRSTHTISATAWQRLCPER